MSYVKSRGRGYTAYWVFTDPATGQRKEASRSGFKPTTRGRREAERYGAAMESAASEGTWRPEKRLTVSELLREYYLPAKRSEGLREATLAQYEAACLWLAPVGGLELRALTPRHCQDLAEALRKDGSRLGRGGLSPRSVQLALSVLKAATGYAVANGLVLRDPLSGYRRPRAAQSTASGSWSIEEARTFLAFTADNRLSAAWQLLITRGLRRGELAGLRWDAVDLEGGALRIERTRIIVDGKAVESIPKTSAGRRRVPLDAALVSAFRAHRRGQLEERLKAGAAYRAGDYVFCNELGQPYHPDWWDERFDRLTAGAGLRRLRLHDLRHTAVSIMAVSGVPAYVAAQVVGHSSSRTIEAVYRHTLPGQADEAGEAISKALLGS